MAMTTAAGSSGVTGGWQLGSLKFEG